MQKTINLKKGAIALFLAAAIFLCVLFSFGTTAFADISESSDENGIQTYADAPADYSSYTDNILPDASQINNKTIAQYVPIELFNKDATTIYNGRNYGFIVHSAAKTNHVLLFKEIYSKSADGDGYEVEMRTVYEKSFFKIGNNITNAGSPMKLGLANVRFNSYIIDSDIKNNTSMANYDKGNDTGAFFVSSGYDGSFKYFNDDLVKDMVSFGVSCASMVLSKFENTEFLSDIIDFVSLTADAAQIAIEHATNGFWLKDTVLNNTVNLALTRQGQFNEYGGLAKGMTVGIKESKESYLSYAEGKDGYAKAKFRINNEYKEDYYVHNNISFDVVKFSGANSYFDVGRYSSQSVFDMTDNGVVDKCGRVYKNGDNFEFESCQRIIPLSKANAFKFIAEEAGQYKFNIPDGYFLYINNQKQDNTIVRLEKGQYYIGVGKNGSVHTGEMADTRMVMQDFIDEKMMFAEININLVQEIKYNEPSTLDDIGYSVLSSNLDNNSLQIFDIGNGNNVNAYLTDKDLNILSQTYSKDGKLYVNYPMRANEVYYVLAENMMGESLDVLLTKKDELIYGDNSYNSVLGLYYRYLSPYSQFYRIDGGDLVNIFGSQIAYTQDGYYLNAGENYYLKSDSEKINIHLSESKYNFINSVNTSIDCSEIYNQVFLYTAPINANFNFGDAECDIIQDGELIAQRVSEYVFRENKSYVIVKSDIGGEFILGIGEKNLTLGVNSIVCDTFYSTFTFEIESEFLLSIESNPDNPVKVYDSNLTEIEMDHGYSLEQGKYFLVFTEDGEFDVNLKESLIPVNVVLVVEGKIYPDDGIYYYGKYYQLPVPVRDRYDFNGWKLGSKLVTDATGASLGKLKQDYALFEATWTLRAIVMEIKIDDMTSKWWTGEDIVSQKPGEVYIEGDLIDQLINLKSEFVLLDSGKKQGHFLSTFDYVKTSSQGKIDYYSFTPVWEIEKYFIEFIPPYPGIAATSRAISYGEAINTSTFPSEAFALANPQLYELVGWKNGSDGGTFIFKIGNTLIDLTPGIGSEYNYDSNGDGVLDCALIRLSAELDMVDYTVTIKGRRIAITETGYTLGKFGDYGIAVSSFKGKNVLYATERKDKLFAEGGKITKNDLISYWNEGDGSVAVELISYATPVTVNLSYSDVCNNPDTYVGTQGNVSLSECFVREWDFVGWEVDRRQISMLNYDALGINGYYSTLAGIEISKKIEAILSRESLMAKYDTSYEINKTSYVYMTGETSILKRRKVSFIIGASTNQVTFSRSNGDWSDTNIVVKSRSNKLIINFEDGLSMYAKHSESVINASLCPQLELYSYGEVKLRAGETWGDDVESHAAITGKDIIFKGNTFNVIGGNGVNKSATEAICGVGDSYSTLIFAADVVNIVGGRGQSGKQGVQGKNSSTLGGQGSRGEVGAYGIVFPGKIMINSGIVNVTGGQGGRGGMGGRGFDGVDGKFLIPHQSPSDGGPGGPGGPGGSAIPSSTDYRTNGGDINLYEGEVGEGGSGGPAGASCKNYNGTKTYTANPGLSYDEWIKR